MNMLPFRIILYLFACCAYCSAQSVVLQTAIDEHTTLTLREGDNPCAVIDQMCCNDESPDEYSECFSSVHPLVTRQLTALWRHFAARLTMEPSIFLDCKGVDMYHGHYYNTSLNHRSSSEQAVESLLDILRSDGGERAAREFDVRKNDYFMTAGEQAQLYLKAILLEPNHPLIVGQFGVTLLAIEREDLARALFADAVRRGIWEHTMQRPVNYYVPGLTSKPWYDAREFSFAAVLEQGYEDIRRELIDVTTGGGDDIFYVEAENRNSFNSDGSWKTLVVKESNSYTDLAKKYFPKTIAWLDKCENDFLLVKFSSLKPGTHIRPHTGPSNERLRSHFTLIHSGGARLRVGSEWRTWEEGKVVVFDSSWEHEVIHEGSQRRVVLILDIWHPDYLNHYGDSH